MVAAYATAGELNEFLPADVNVADAQRLLARASELLDDKVRTPFNVDTGGAPTYPPYLTALRDACCAQVEFWLQVGEDHDVEGLANRQASIGQLSLSALPPELAPRAKRILRTAGLLPTGVPETAPIDYLTVIR